MVFVLVVVGSYQFFVFALGPRLLRALPPEEEKFGEGVSAKGMQRVQRLQRWNLTAVA
ncbi:MAG: hypothetical protein ACE5I9_07810 [Candidatus Methylomirabilales bacterium]